MSVDPQRVVMEYSGLEGSRADLSKVYVRPDIGSRVEMLEHLQWMIDNFPDGEKGHRWLGFIQGARWAMGLNSINELRLHSRGCGDE